jgi:hypothetical protein
VRKSRTLPHSMNSLTSASTPTKRKDLANLFGLHDRGPGTPSRDVTQMVALQSLPNVARASPAEVVSPTKKNLNKFLGIEQEQEQQRRARPQSLTMAGGSPSSVRAMKLNQLKALNKTLSRLTSTSTVTYGVAQSAPTTPDYPFSVFQQQPSPQTETLSPLKKKNLCKFLGLPPPPPPIPPPRTVSQAKKLLLQQQIQQQQQPQSILKMTSTLSSSTPDDLEKENVEVVMEDRGRFSHSNDGLDTPGGCNTPTMIMTPERTFGSSSVIVGPKQSNSMFSLATASNSLQRPPMSSNSLTRRQHVVVQSVRHPPHQHFVNSCSLQRGATVFHHQPPQQPQSRTLPRSVTLDDMDNLVTPAVNWVQRPSSSSVRRQSSLHQTNRVALSNGAGQTRRSQSTASAYFRPGPAPQWPPPQTSDANNTLCLCPGGGNSREQIYVTMSPHQQPGNFIAPTVLTLNPPSSSRATTKVMVNSSDAEYMDMNVKVKTTAIVHNAPPSQNMDDRYCLMPLQRTVVQIRGEGEGAEAVAIIDRLDSELEETI